MLNARLVSGNLAGKDGGREGEGEGSGTLLCLHYFPIFHLHHMCKWRRMIGKYD